MLYPTENQYIDLHTHLPWNYPNIFSIRNYVEKSEMEAALQSDHALSAGVHPWKCMPGEEEGFLELVKKASVLPQFLAIGECGIDLKIETACEFQESLFLKQAQIAEEVQKPLLIHCVRAYHQFQQLIQSFKPSVPWIFHGFNNTVQVAEQLVKHGACLSIGQDLTKENSKIRAAFFNLPMESVFFETDEWQQPVWKLYAEAARVIGWPENELKKMVSDNFIRCFKRPENSMPDDKC